MNLTKILKGLYLAIRILMLYGSRRFLVASLVKSLGEIRQFGRTKMEQVKAFALIMALPVTKAP